MLIEHIINKDMIKAKEVLQEKMSILTAKLMLEMKKEIAARLSEGKVEELHKVVHDGPHYKVSVHKGGVHVVSITGKYGEHPIPQGSYHIHHLNTVATDMVPPAANDQHSDKTYHRAIALAPIMRAADNGGKVDTETVHRALRAAGNTLKRRG